MAKLIIETPESDTKDSVGGVPWAGEGTQWPLCRTCGSPMQFLAQLPLSHCGVERLVTRGQRLLLFQCQNQPGLCEEWDADSGGNAALLMDASGSRRLEVPPGPTLLDAESPVGFQEYDDSRQEESLDDEYCRALDADPRVVGKVGGRPVWIQGDETPSCECGETMVFVAQLECHGGGDINFGDAGAGYAFVCPRCSHSAKFLWQCG
jgi:uncharacterized protein YwqG